MGTQVLAANALTAGLRNDFVGTYRPLYERVTARVRNLMQLGVPSDKLTELFAYPESAPHPKRWIRGETISSKPFKYVQFSVTNVDWGLRIEWHQNDREDDQTGSLFTQARIGGQNFGLMHERIYFQILQGTTDLNLLATIPNAPDGAALFATTAAGANRFGVSSGNLLTGTGVASSAAIRTDFFNAIEQFQLFQDTEGQPLLDPSIIDDGGVTVIFGIANRQVFAEAFLQGRTVQVVQNVAATENVAAATPTNVILDSGLRVTLFGTARITDNDWYINADGLTQKPIFQLERRGLQEAFANIDTSDVSRDTKKEYIQWDARYGYGINVPYGIIKINN